MTLETYAALAARILAGAPRCGHTRLVAVDGPGGAGKSVFARRLAARLGGAPVVHTDDFASLDNRLDWWPLLEGQVLEPLGAGRAGRFRRYDWDDSALAEWVEVPAAGTVVIEGVSSARAAVADRLSCAIWIETAPAVRLRRGLDRDGDGALPLWQEWMAEEDRHYDRDRTALRADVVVDGNSAIQYDLDTAFSRLR